MYSISEVQIFKALSDENRLRALMALSENELCACHIVELLKLAPSTVSKHMSVLRLAGLVKAEKAGRWVNFSHPGRDASDAVKKTIKTLLGMFSNNPQIKKDRDQLKRILKIDHEQLCENQSKC
jgi:ArsR family transcriptional regulator, arsenate/arsenite/antimonite-responsive transcriptional repressor